MGLSLTTPLSFGPPAIAWGGAEGAVLVAEQTGDGGAITLARFNGQGNSVGSPEVIGGSMTSSFLGPSLALAANGSEYLACWDGATGPGVGVDCVTVPTGSGAASPVAYTDPGTSPSAAVGASGFVLVDLTQAGSLNVQALTAVGAASGQPFTASAATLPLVVARSGGDAVGYLSGTALEAVFVDSTGVVGQELDTFSPAWGGSDPFALGASGMSVAAVWYEFTTSTQGVFAAIRGNGTQGIPVLISGTGTTYGRVAVAGANNSYAATWSDIGASIMYVALDSTGTPVGAAVPALSVGWDDNPHALTAVADGFMLAALSGTSAQTLQLAHLSCP